MPSATIKIFLPTVIPSGFERQNYQIGRAKPLLDLEANLTVCLLVENRRGPVSTS